MESILKILVAIMSICAVGLLIAFPIMWLWNYLMPEIFGLTTIGFRQAFALHILCNILIKGVSTSVSKK